MRPLELGPNLLRRFYRGGARIGAFRGVEARDDTPEDWVGSTTRAHGEPELGRSRLPDGTPLDEALSADPERFFEPAHLERHGPEPGVLVKLLDAGERLPVHLHPDDAFAARELGEPCGKTEAWLVVEAEPGAEMRLGWSREVGEDELAHWFAEQDVESMLAATVPVPVAAGDAIFVPAGLAHAIGAGILLLELQQPADLSLLLERHGAAEREALLGLEAATALAAVHRGALPPAEVARLCAGRGRQPLPAEADAFFRAELVGGGDSLEAGFSILVGTGGAASLETEHGGAVPLRRGSTLLVPYAAGACTVAGDATAIRCRGPE